MIFFFHLLSISTYSYIGIEKDTAVCYTAFTKPLFSDDLIWLSKIHEWQTGSIKWFQRRGLVSVSNDGHPSKSDPTKHCLPIKIGLILLGKQCLAGIACISRLSYKQCLFRFIFFFWIIHATHAGHTRCIRAIISWIWFKSNQIAVCYIQTKSKVYCVHQILHYETN